MALLGDSAAASESTPPDRYTFVLFTDNLSDLSIAEVCRGAREAGFDGLDLTVRPGGHVPPEKAARMLPEAVAVAMEEGVSIPMISTAITSREDPDAAPIFETASELGITRAKLGYWRYEPFGTAEEQIDEAKSKLEGIVELTSRISILPCVHVHSGRILANGGPLAYLILRGFDPKEAGAYVDPMHMTVEGGLAGWEIGLDLVAPWTALVGIKNFRWRESEGADRELETEYTPLSEGVAPLGPFMRYLAQSEYQGIVSLHSEYKGKNSFQDLSTPELLKQSAEDLKYLKSLI